MIDWDIYAENMNSIILAAIDHGGDAGGAYFSCASKLRYKMEQLLYIVADFSDYYKVDNVYIEEYLTEIPQFVKL